jgi:hypothetical protein
MPHINSVDFAVWPALREYVVQINSMQERMQWLMDMCNHLRCDWYFSDEEALCRDEETGQTDLCDLAKVRLRYASTSVNCTQH